MTNEQAWDSQLMNKQLHIIKHQLEASDMDDKLKGHKLFKSE